MSKKPKKTEYRFIRFVPFASLFADSPKVWYCQNKRQQSRLGECAYYPQWKQYIFCAENPRVVFSTDCLRDIAHFMEQLK